MTTLTPRVRLLRQALSFGILKEMKQMIALVVATVLVVLGNTVATEFYLYFTTWWADVVMHFLGGAWMAIAAAAFAYGFNRRISLAAAVLVSFVVGVAWEGYELWFNMIVWSDWVDSLADLALDVIGGVAAYFALNLGEGDVEPAPAPGVPKATDVAGAGLTDPSE